MILLLILQSIILLFTSNPDIKPEREYQANCTECHKELSSGSNKHSDLLGSCDICHNPTGADHPDSEAKGFELSDKIPGLCYMCHEQLYSMEFVHYPVQEGDCMTCHSPHSSNRKSLILDDLSENLCLDCHDNSAEEAKSLHQPYRKGECLKCHDAHQSNNKAISSKNEQELCLSCHKRVLSGRSVHSPAETGDCQICHKPHSSTLNSLLTASYPEKLYAAATNENFELCFTCHDINMIAEETTEYSTSFRDNNRNLHYTHINGEKGRSCSVCHEMHASQTSPLIRERLQFGDWKMSLGYLRSESGGTCNTACHSQKSYNRE